MVGCEGDASPYFTCGVIGAATKGCILRTAGETRRHKNPHSVPHEQLVPTAGLHCPAGREAVDRTEAGFRQHVLVFTGAEHDIVLASGPGDQSVRERNATAVLARAVAQGAERGAQLHGLRPAERGREGAPRRRFSSTTIAAPRDRRPTRLAAGPVEGVRGELDSEPTRAANTCDLCGSDSTDRRLTGQTMSATLASGDQGARHLLLGRPERDGDGRLPGTSNEGAERGGTRLGLWGMGGQVRRGRGRRRRVGLWEC